MNRVRSTHAYRLSGLGTPREMLLAVYMTVDGVDRYLSVQAARELAEDLLIAADRASRSSAEVRQSLLGR